MDTQIKAYSSPQLAELMKDIGQSAFRAKQLEEWLYIHHVDSYDKMTNLPKALGEKLAATHPLYMPVISEKLISRDGTRKYLIQFNDQSFVEAVAIPSKDGSRLTVCFSTQIGCAMACSFCATGQEGFQRNLLVGEIIDQVLLIQEDMGRRVTNLVGMGQGEPFLNYDNVLAALRILNNPKGIGIGARHISISSCGILPSIERFSHEPEQFTLAISLHSAVQETRDMLMPKVSHYTLPQLKKVLQTYIQKTGRRVTLEYAMIQNVNDSEDALRALLSFCQGLLCHINLIPINEVAGSSYRPSSPKTLSLWVDYLGNKGFETTIRDSRGSDIDGACGQLKQVRLLNK